MESITTLLARHEINISDINDFMFSQFSVGNIQHVCDGLGVSTEKAFYIGDEFGYTATNSPLLVIHQAVVNKKLPVAISLCSGPLAQGGKTQHF